MSNLCCSNIYGDGLSHWYPGDLPGTIAIEWSCRKLSTALSYAPQWNANCPDLAQMARVCEDEYVRAVVPLFPEDTAALLDL